MFKISRNQRGTFLGGLAALALLGGLTGGCTKEEPAGHVDWLTDLAKGQAEAKAKSKVVFLNFTGTDWCPPCILLEKKVLRTKKFQDFAEKNLVLVLEDVPELKSPSDELQALLTKFEINQFPTIVLLDGDGKKLGKIDQYAGGTPDDFIAEVEKALKKG